MTKFNGVIMQKEMVFITLSILSLIQDMASEGADKDCDLVFKTICII